ncbi:MAG: hypothetical protein LBL45_12315 [Treponema sp.]|jgi:hypothetical protein|nr:hypothetical protein [Treponema sp.]
MVIHKVVWVLNEAVVDVKKNAVSNTFQWLNGFFEKQQSLQKTRRILRLI